MKRSLLTFALIAALLFCFCACSSRDDSYSGEMNPAGSYNAENADANYVYDEVVENGFSDASENNTSYFSLDRNTASYTYMRREISDGYTVSSDSVRLEEYVNYFSYDYARPTDGEALALSGSVFDCPWNSSHKLLTIGVAADVVEMSDKPNNIVFLIDTSGSMSGDSRLGLIQQAFTMLLENLTDNDRVSIVTYAGNVRTALAGARGSEKTRIANILQDLMAGGSTNGEGGIETAYEVAETYFMANGNNRVILATDGDFNVGISDKDQLKSFISEKRASGIYLSVLGVGMLNTNDTTMKTLAENGNGNYAYLDSVAEARKVLVTELGGTCVTVAEDAKIGVVFNEEVVESFRLIGYETKMMSQEEFEDENKDAGEIGSGHTVTAVYELQLREEATGEIATAELRYKTPPTDSSDDDSSRQKSVSLSFTTDDYTATPSEDCVFIGCVVEYGLLLRNSAYKGDASFEALTQRLQTLQSVTGENANEFRAEFLQLVGKAAELYKAKEG